MKKLIILILLLLCLTASVSHSQSFKMFGQLLNPHWSTDGLVFYWRGIEAVEVVDESLYRNHGTITGATWVGQGLHFLGADSHVNFGDFSAISGSTWSPVSFVIWARRASPLTFGGLYRLKSGSQSHTAFFYDDGDFAYGNTGGTWERLNSNTWTDTTQYHQIVIVELSSTSVSFYFDGLYVGTLSSTQCTTPWDDVVFAGYRDTSTGNEWDGDIKSFSIYMRGLSVSEIAALTLNPDLPMQQDPIWLFMPPPAVVTGQVIIITKHEKKSTIMSILSSLWEGIWALV